MKKLIYIQFIILFILINSCNQDVNQVTSPNTSENTKLNQKIDQEILYGSQLLLEIKNSHPALHKQYKDKLNSLFVGYRTASQEKKNTISKKQLELIREFINVCNSNKIIPKESKATNRILLGRVLRVYLEEILCIGLPAYIYGSNVFYDDDDYCDLPNRDFWFFIDYQNGILFAIIPEQYEDCVQDVIDSYPTYAYEWEP